MKDKAVLRREASERRRAMSSRAREEASKHIAERLFSMELWERAGSVFLYCGCGDEVHTDIIIDRGLSEERELYLPKVVSDHDMVFIHIRSREDMSPGAYGILEPKDNGIYETGAPGLIIVPCVGTDIRGNRIGHGKGYYDRYLSRYRDVPRVCLAYECQIVEDFEPDEDDVRMDHIVTEKRIIDAGRKQDTQHFVQG